jgi:hypothetical protein
LAVVAVFVQRPPKHFERCADGLPTVQGEALHGEPQKIGSRHFQVLVTPEGLGQLVIGNSPRHQVEHGYR